MPDHLTPKASRARTRGGTQVGGMVYLGENPQDATKVPKMPSGVFEDLGVHIPIRPKIPKMPRFAPPRVRARERLPILAVHTESMPWGRAVAARRARQMGVVACLAGRPPA